MIRLIGHGLRPWVEFELDPDTGRYTKRRLKQIPDSRRGYAGDAQELSVRGLGTVLCAVFVHRQEILLRVGESVWNLFQPGLVISHHEGFWRCELCVTTPDGKRTTFRYRRKDWFLVIIDTTYDNLDFEIANLPPNLPDLAARKQEELVAEWTTCAAGPARP